jgi:hypothetical protein
MPRKNSQEQSSPSEPRRRGIVAPVAIGLTAVLSAGGFYAVEQASSQRYAYEITMAKEAEAAGKADGFDIVSANGFGHYGYEVVIKTDDGRQITADARDKVENGHVVDLFDYRIIGHTCTGVAVEYNFNTPQELKERVLNSNICETSAPDQPN